jgi:hypothetical protein
MRPKVVQATEDVCAMAQMVDLEPSAMQAEVQSSELGVYKVAMGQVILQIPWFSRGSMIVPVLYTHILFTCHQCYTNLAPDNTDNYDLFLVTENLKRVHLQNRL